MRESDIDDAKGRLKEATGAVTGNKELEREGEKDQFAAKAKDAVEDAKDKASDMIDKAKDAFSRDK